MAADYHIDVTDSSPEPSWDSKVSEVTKKWGTFMSSTDQAAVTAGSQIHDQIAARNAVIRKGIDAMMSAVPTGKIAGFTGATVVRSLASSAMDQGTNSVLDKFLPTDYSSLDLANSLSASGRTEAVVTTSLVDAFVHQDVWANSADKSKDELVAEFLRTICRNLGEKEELDRRYVLKNGWGLLVFTNGPHQRLVNDVLSSPSSNNQSLYRPCESIGCYPSAGITPITGFHSRGMRSAMKPA